MISLLRSTVSLLNQPIIKAGIKSGASLLTFSVGVVEVYDLCRLVRKEGPTASIGMVGRVSLILSGLVSYQGQWIVSKNIGRCIDPNLFGPSAIFATNPYHPKHVTSLVAFGLALPGAFRPLLVKEESPKEALLSDTTVSCLLWFNLLTSRPVLHQGNQVARLLGLRG